MNQPEKNQKKITRTLSGLVVSNKMDKTAVVRVDRIKRHPVYQKQFRVSKKYKVHDPKNSCQIGDQVAFREVRPLSKDKRWLLVKIEKSNQA
ncbi:MAG: 30S ribosomal protein S17 [bacterium]